MFMTKICIKEGCTSPSLSVIKEGQIIEEQASYCLSHAEDKEKTSAEIIQYIVTHDVITGLCANGIKLEDLDLSHKKFYGCNFCHSSFSNVQLNAVRVKLCTFDFSTFADCNMTSSSIQFCSFAGSKFIHVVLTGSDIIQTNCNGIIAYQCSFDDSDLYASRFIRAMLINASMNNCNLKKTVFYNSARENVSFKLSNTRESLLMRGQDTTELIDYPLPNDDKDKQ